MATWISHGPDPDIRASSLDQQSAGKSDQFILHYVSVFLYHFKIEILLFIITSVQ